VYTLTIVRVYTIFLMCTMTICLLLLFQYAAKLAEFLNKEMATNKKKIHIWTSLLKRTVQTVAHVDTSKEHWKALNEIDAVMLCFLIITLN